MSTIQLIVTLAVHDAFTAFISNESLLALPLSLEHSTLHPLSAIHSKTADSSSQANLNLLDDVLSPTASLYLLLRRGNCIFAITFILYRALKDEREHHLQYRHDLVKVLGEEHFKMSLICKEIGEITDTRSWVERDEKESGETQHSSICEDLPGKHSVGTKDTEYRKNKCRLCDRRMKNKITDGALKALSKLENEGDLVQISLASDLALALKLQITSVQTDHVSRHLPTTHPTFTFYRHPNKLLYFIFHSPDSATVQQRMKHTMAIPGLVNVHAEDCGAHVDQKIEVHEPEDLGFEKGDKKAGKFRSMYWRGGWHGTESQYEGLEKDREFYNATQYWRETERHQTQ